MNHLRTPNDRIASAVSEAGNGGSLYGLLDRDEHLRTRATLANALLILELDPDVAGLCAYDEFAERFVLTRPPPPARSANPPLPGPYPRPWTVQDAALVLAYMQRAWSHRFTMLTVEQAMPTDARRNGYHPVRDWLATLRWDGHDRLSVWLAKAFGCPADGFAGDYHRRAGRAFLVAAVKRVRKPGVKFDHTPVLEGLQGLGKSTAFRRLFGEDWFSDSLPPDLASKDAAMALAGCWCLEMAELQQLIRAHPAEVKAFLTRQVDRFRPPYGKTYIDRPRQTVLVGTTNEAEWLADVTGNRRFWPLACSHVDLDWIDANRDQLWAEAAACEAAGEAWWLADEDSRRGAEEAQAERLIEDAWAEKVLRHLNEMGRVEVTTSSVMDAIGIPIAQQNRASQMRVAAIIRGSGWGKMHTERGKVWVSPTRLGR